MATDAATSIEIDAPPRITWAALQSLARSTAGSPRGATLTWHFTHADVAINAVLPAEGASGSGRWDGVDFRVCAHLVPQGAQVTLLVLTAAPSAACRGTSAPTHVRSALRHARGDLRALAEAVAVQVAARAKT